MGTIYNYNLEWIPCKERMPEEFKTVLITATTQGGLSIFASEWVHGKDADGNIRYFWTGAHGRRVLAWAECPEPYNPWKNNKKKLTKS